jgi:AhpD family alkylhydroperoxidase
MMTRRGLDFFVGAVTASIVAGGLVAAQPQDKPSPDKSMNDTSKPANKPANKPGKSAPMGPQDAATLKDIEATVGFVPQFFKQVAPTMLPAFWNTMKTFEMGETQLDGKTKELIGLAVAAQIPCEYCIVFHTESLRSMGVSEQEIAEAVAMSAVTREGSTLLNGLQVDRSQFKRDIERMSRTSRQARK